MPVRENRGGQRGQIVCGLQKHERIWYVLILLCLEYRIHRGKYYMMVKQDRDGK